MADIENVRASMLSHPEIWKWNNMLYEIVKVVTSPEPLFFQDEDWMNTYNIYTGGEGWIIDRIASRARKKAPIESEPIDCNIPEQVKEVVRLAALMSITYADSPEFVDVKWYNNSAYLPHNATITYSDKPTSIKLIKKYMKAHKNSGTYIFELLYKDTESWVRTLVIPNTKLRIRSLEICLEKYGILTDSDWSYWLVYRRLFSNEIDCVNTLINRVIETEKTLLEYEPELYDLAEKDEKKFCVDVFRACSPFLNERIDKAVATLRNSAFNSESVITAFKNDCEVYKQHASC